MIINKRQHGFAHIVLVALVIIAAVSAATVVYFKQTASDTKTEKTVTASQKQGVRTQQVMIDIEATLPNEYKIIRVNGESSEPNPSLGDSDLQVTYATSSPDYKVPGYDFYTNSGDGSSLLIFTPFKLADDSVASKKILATYRSNIDVVFKKYGLVKKSSNAANDHPSAMFESKDLVCEVGTDYLNNWVDLSCGTRAGLLAAAQKSQPLFKAVPADQKTSSTYLSLGKITISKTAGYKTAAASIGDVSGGGSAIYFYQAPGDEWTYFMNTQEGLYCDNINTAVLRRAFNGQTCMNINGTGESKVVLLASDKN